MNSRNFTLNPARNAQYLSRKCLFDEEVVEDQELPHVLTEAPWMLCYWKLV